MGNTVIEVNKAWSFSTMSVDNINVDIQSSLSTTSLHGTAASINQHPTRNNEGQTGQRICLNKGVSKLKKHSTGILKHHHITYQMIHLSPFAVSRPLQTYWRALFCRKMRLARAARSISNILGCVLRTFSISSIVSRYSG